MKQITLEKTNNMVSKLDADKMKSILDGTEWLEILVVGNPGVGKSSLISRLGVSMRTNSILFYFILFLSC